MRYTGTIYKGVVISKGITYTDYMDKNEVELTEEQYNTLPIPCKLTNGEFIPCDFPEMESGDVVIEETEPTEIERLRADIDFIAVMTGVEL